MAGSRGDIRGLLLAIIAGGVFAWAASAAKAGMDAPGEVYFYDMTHLHELDRADPVQARTAWDTAHLVASVQGIVNRNTPRLFVRFMPRADDFWFDWLKKEGQWLAGREVVVLDSLEDLLQVFADEIAGVVVYDEQVWATSNVASTIAGVENRACLRHDRSPDSIYVYVMGLDHAFTKNALRLLHDNDSPMFTGQGEIPDGAGPSSGSAKCDAYLWAKHRYLDEGRCSRRYLANYLDAYWLRRPTESGFSNATLTNHDFFIAQKAFFFDLNVWEEEAPVDDPAQTPGTDLRTLRTILDSMARHAEGRILHIGGFTPWAWKYTNHAHAGGRHGGVDTEWKYAQVISSYNGIMDADALGLSGMANASFYQHHPLEERYPQHPKPTREELERRGLLLPDGRVAPRAFVCFYMGDYDSAAWFNLRVPKYWNDPAHGEVICSWAFNPNLDRRAPHAMHFVRTQAAPNDWFMFGDSGAGYLNPGMLMAPHRDSGLPDGLEAWVKHNLAYADRYDLSITGFIIDGHSPGMGDQGMRAYAQFSPDGIVGQKIPPQGLYKDRMPYVRMRMDLHGDPESAGKRIAGLTGANVPKFLFIRTILKSPTWHKRVMECARAADEDVVFLDPYSFFLLLKTHEWNRANGTGVSETRRRVGFSAETGRAGLAPIPVEDGRFEMMKADGVPALHQSANDEMLYVYFETSDSLAEQLQQQPGASVVVTVTVLDAAAGRLGLQYDSHGRGDYAPVAEQPLTGSGQWVEIRFELPKPRFFHSQNGGADFRLVNPGLDLLIRNVDVRLSSSPS